MLMNEPTNPLGWPVWRRGGMLGLGIALAFFLATGLVYGLLGIMGWSGVGQALCAIAIGPVLALVLLLGVWTIRRPALAPPDPQAPRAPVFDPERTQLSRHTAPLREPAALKKDQLPKDKS
jgi:hypothetical protein